MKKYINILKNTIKKYISQDFRHLSIRDKLIKSFIIVTIIGSISSFISLIFLQKTNNNYQYAINNYGFSQGEIGKVGIDVEHSYSMVKDIVLLSNFNVDPKKTDASQEELDICLKRIESSLDQIHSTNISSEEQNIFNKIKDDIDEYTIGIDRVLELSSEKKSEQAMNMLISKTNPIMQVLSVDITELLDIKIYNCNAMVNKLKVLKIIIITTVLLTISIAFLINILLSKYINTLISKPIENMTKIANKIASGNLDVDMAVESEDEIGQLACSFMEMASILKLYINEIGSILGNISNGDLCVATKEHYRGNFVDIEHSLQKILLSLNETFSEVSVTTYQVNKSSKQVEETAQTLAQGSTQQSASVQQLSSNMIEINKQVQNTAKNASNINIITNSLVKDIKKNNDVMNEMLCAMNEIEKASNEIKNIIKVIDYIAEQTDLLSLNAAIEAARAGESGKGFSVVADEVRKLALQSAGAAKKTSSLIENSIKSVNFGKSLANNVAGGLHDIVKQADKSTKMISDIVLVCEEQASSIDQVNKGILQISDVVQSTSLIAEESALSSEELTLQTAVLEKMIERFKTIPAKE